MIGAYDDISHRLSELFHARRMRENTTAGLSESDCGSLISPEWGDLDEAITTFSHQRPVTVVWFYEHRDDNRHMGLFETKPYSGERPIKVDKSTANVLTFMLYDTTSGASSVSTPHGFISGITKHWDIVSMRNFPERYSSTDNWIYNTRTVKTDWYYPGTGQSYGQGASDSFTSGNGALSTTKTIFYLSPFAVYPGYQTETNVGPVICFDRALSDTELHDFSTSPYDILRRFWSDVLFAVSPLTGEDFSSRRNHWTANYSTSVISGEVESSSPQGLIPYIDHSSARVSGKMKSYFMSPITPTAAAYGPIGGPLYGPFGGPLA